jgi:GWxTD domain-containing protein
MWLSNGHGSFGSTEISASSVEPLAEVGSLSQTVPEKRQEQRCRIAPVSSPSWLFLFLFLSYFAWPTPEPAHAQISASPPSPGAFVDFDQTLGMPPYVFRTYQFAAAEPGKVRVEVHIAMVNDILQFVKTPPDSAGQIRYRALYEINVMIWDKRKNLVDNRNWKRELLVDSFDVTNDRKNPNKERTLFDLPPGEYEIALEITDRDTGKNLRDRRPLKVEDFGSDKLQVSSIIFTQPIPAKRLPADWPQQGNRWQALLALWKAPDRAALRDSLPYNITATVTNLPLSSSMDEGALPDGIIEDTAKPQNGSGKHRSPAFFGPGAYFEIYGAKPGETLHLQYDMLDFRRQPVQEWNETIAVAQSPVCHLTTFDGKLNASGSHTFRLSIKHTGSEASTRSAQQSPVTAEENFQMQVGIDRNFTATNVANKSLLYEPLRYVIKGADHKRMAEADEATRDSLVAEFWRQRDPDPETEANALREEFYRRVTFADMRFAVPALSRSGWETDRGRIYIIYGPPKEVHHQMAEQGSPPLEIWFYPDQDLYFVFRDKTGSGDFDLVNR